MASSIATWKPSNLFVCDDGDGNEHAKLLDFGIAKHDAASRSITMTAAFVGTPHYAAPEMISGVEAGFSSDLYSLGALAFFALTGSPPFDALSRSGVLHAHVNRSAPRVDSVRPAVPSEVADIVARALEKDPAARFPSAQAMSQALQRVLWRMHRDALEHAPDKEPSDALRHRPSVEATGSTIEPLRARRGVPT
ncbi:MAG: serine/threonine-protein kinase [Polyangiaceae bacterium]